MASDGMDASRSQALVERYQRGELAREAYLDELRRNYHSVHARARSDAINLLDQLPEPERSRELIQLAVDCQWRETRVAIVRVLARKPTQRGLEYLIHLAADEADLGLAREAIDALGRSRSTLAGRFLATRYHMGAPALKPYVAHALGELMDRTLADTFLADLVAANELEQVLWTQSLALALAELKAGDCVPALLAMLHAEPRAVAVSALLALGKVAREPALLDPYDTAFRDDFVACRIYAASRQQIEQRARWVVEDYVEALFDLKAPFYPGLAGLALELNDFPAREVRDGLEYFRDAANRVRMAEVLARLHHAGAMAWIADFVQANSASDTELTDILTALHVRLDHDLEPILNAWRPRCLAAADYLFEAWCRACVLCLPEGGRVLAKVIQSRDFAVLTASRQVSVINYLVDFGLSVLGDAQRLDTVFQGLDALLHDRVAPPIVARALRGFAQLRTASPKAAAFTVSRLDVRDLLPSSLHLLQYCPEAVGFDQLADLIGCLHEHRELATPLLWAMAAQDAVETVTPRKFDDFLRAVLAGDWGQESRLAALAVLRRHHRATLLEPVLDTARGGDRVRVAAIVTLKRFASPRSTATLAACLHDASESIVGRALDSLMAQPDDDARWAILEFLDERIQDVEIVDKIIRCLTPPRRQAARFGKRMRKIAEANPDHDLIDGLAQWCDRMGVAGEAEPVVKLPDGGLPRDVVHELDHGLVQRLEGFERLDEQVKAALRSAELPYLHPDVFHGDVDKSTSIIEYCKAVDLLLERRLGAQRLLPTLRDNHAAFQNIIYRSGLNALHPNPATVVEALGLRGLARPEALPLSKMTRVSQSILDGRLSQAQWRILDGLRAWSAVLFLFIRSADSLDASGLAAPILIPHTSDRDIAELAVRLDRLQDLRNPVAHRRTLVAFADIETIRNDMADLFAVLGQMFPS